MPLAFFLHLLPTNTFLPWDFPQCLESTLVHVPQGLWVSVWEGHQVTKEDFGPSEPILTALCLHSIPLTFKQDASVFTFTLHPYCHSPHLTPLPSPHPLRSPSQFLSNSSGSGWRFLFLTSWSPNYSEVWIPLCFFHCCFSRAWNGVSSTKHTQYMGATSCSYESPG